MAESKVYKVKKDISLPRAVSLIGETPEGKPRYQTEGRNYPAGSYALQENISPTVQERVNNGDLDDFLEEVSGNEANAVRELGNDDQFFGTYIPEHEVESYYFRNYGHTVVPRDQVIEMKAAGSDAAAENLANAKEDGADEREMLPRYADEVPSLAEVSRGEEEAVVPLDSDHVDTEDLAGVEQPPGLPVGDDLVAAEGGTPRKRGRPRKKDSE